MDLGPVLGPELLTWGRTRWVWGRIGDENRSWSIFERQSDREREPRSARSNAKERDSPGGEERKADLGQNDRSFVLYMDDCKTKDGRPAMLRLSTSRGRALSRLSVSRGGVLSGAITRPAQAAVDAPDHTRCARAGGDRASSGKGEDGGARPQRLSGASAPPIKQFSFNSSS
jgi:hypothetical protein